jgi:hypothetical protein
VDRARLAQQIVETRIREGGIEVSDIRFDLIGANSLYGNQISKGEPYEVRLRVAGRCADRAQANAIGNEVETLYTNGPAGGGGVSKVVSEVLAIQSVLIDESRVAAKIHYKSI